MTMITPIPPIAPKPVKIDRPFAWTAAPVEEEAEAAVVEACELSGGRLTTEVGIKTDVKLDEALLCEVVLTAALDIELMAILDVDGRVTVRFDNVTGFEGAAAHCSKYA